MGASGEALVLALLTYICRRCRRRRANSAVIAVVLCVCVRRCRRRRPRRCPAAAAGFARRPSSCSRRRLLTLCYEYAMLRVGVGVKQFLKLGSRCLV